MSNKNRIKKDKDRDFGIKTIDDSKVDEVILEAENNAQEEKLRSANAVNSGESVKNVGEKISMILVFILLILSIIQSVELFNLRSQIIKGQFTTGASAAPAAGGSQGLPSQQGGC